MINKQIKSNDKKILDFIAFYSKKGDVFYDKKL